MTDATPLLSIDLGAAPGLAEDASRTAPWFERLRVLSDAQEVGFLDLPAEQQRVAEACAAYAAKAPTVDDIVLVGIGGSALSARVIDTMRPRAGEWPRLRVFDTVDPYALDTMLDLDKGSVKAEIEAAMEGHIIESAELLGLYTRG